MILPGRDPLPRPLLAALRCPICGADYPDGGALRCTAGHEPTVRDGYLDFWSGTDDPAVARTLSSFGYEWNTFDAIQPEDNEFVRRYVADVPALDGDGLGLDAACGKGRYTRFIAPFVNTMVALDASMAVEAATRNLKDIPNVVVVRADLRNPPFHPERFRFVSCLGVLHHLTDPRQGFHVLARLLEPGGLFLLNLYSRPERPGLRSAGLRAAAALRRLTVHLPLPVVRWFSAPLAGVLYAALVIPGAVGARLGLRPLSALPLSVYRGQPVRSLWLDTFDRLSAPLEARFIWSELEPWFEEEGLVVLAVREEAGFYVLLQRPLEAASTGDG